VSYEDSLVGDEKERTVEKQESHEITPSPIQVITETLDQEENHNLEEDKGKKVFAD
jgi:hypothetical protein